MPLAVAYLDMIDAIADVFANMPASKEDAAAAIASAYHDYAQVGLFGGAVPVLLNTFRDAMADTLAIGLTVPGAPPSIANAFANAVDVYWGALVPVPCAGPGGSGTSTGCPGKSSLVGALSGVFANLANTAATCGAGVGNALHTATLTVTANINGSDVLIT